MSFVWPEGSGSGGGGPTPPPGPPGLVIYSPTNGNVQVNGAPALGRWDGVVWTGPYGSGQAALVSTEPPGATGYHARTLSAITDAGVQYPLVATRNTVGGFNTFEFALVLPVPPGSTGISEITIGTNVAAFAGTSGAVTLTYNPLNGGAQGATSRAVSGVDPVSTFVDLQLAGPLANVTVGHVVEIRYGMQLGIGTNIQGTFGRLQIDWI